LEKAIERNDGIQLAESIKEIKRNGFEAFEQKLVRKGVKLLQYLAQEEEKALKAMPSQPAPPPPPPAAATSTSSDKKASSRMSFSLFGASSPSSKTTTTTTSSPTPIVVNDAAPVRVQARRLSQMVVEVEAAPPDNQYDRNGNARLNTRFNRLSLLSI
jgi:hypothetical protein